MVPFSEALLRAFQAWIKADGLVVVLVRSLGLAQFLVGNIPVVVGLGILRVEAALRAA